MDKADGLVYAHLLGNHIQQQILTWDDVNAWRPGQGLLWIHLDAANETALDWLEQKSGLNQLEKEALLESGTRPRIAATDRGAIVILRGVNCNPGADPEDMVAVRMFISNERIITMRRSPRHGHSGCP